MRSQTDTMNIEEFGSALIMTRDLDPGCLIWSGKRYPRIKVDGKLIAVHRYVLEKKLGRKLLPGHFSLHRCNNNQCVEEQHLYEGTQLQNMRDRLRSGRYARGENHPLRLDPSRAARGDQNGSRIYPERLQRGEDRPAAKLTEAKVRLAREMYDGGGWTIRQLAKEFGVTFSPMHHAIRRVGWKHVM